MQLKHVQDSPERSLHHRHFEETKLHKYAADHERVHSALRFPLLQI